MTPCGLPHWEPTLGFEPEILRCHHKGDSWIALVGNPGEEDKSHHTWCYTCECGDTHIFDFPMSLWTCVHGDVPQCASTWNSRDDNPTLDWVSFLIDLLDGTL